MATRILYSAALITSLVIILSSFSSDAAASGPQKSVRHFKNSILNIENKHKVEMTIMDDSDEDNEVNFMVIGDWGGLPVFPYRTLIENTVSQLMSTMGEKYSTKFQLALGDNFYFNGVKDLDDSRFKDTFENVFKSEHLMETPFITVMGNHDHYGNASAQIAYTDQYKRWILPSYNYTFDVKLSGHKDKTFIRFLMIDTVTMCGNTGYDWEHYKEPKFSTKRERLQAKQYFDGIEEELEKLNDEYVPYVIVAGHFPVWSIGEHGPTKCLVEKLHPLLHKYNVSAYFCGHDHSLQHLTETFLDQTVEYFVIGASNFVADTKAHESAVPKNSLKYFWAYGDGIINGGFSLVKATSENMTFTFIETNGHDLYQKVFYPRPYNGK